MKSLRAILAALLCMSLVLSPMAAARAEEGGEKIEEMYVSSSDQVYLISFEQGSCAIHTDDLATMETIDDAAQIFKDHPLWRASIEGSASNEGKTELNETLSQCRANAFARALFARGVAQDQIDRIGMGERGNGPNYRAAVIKWDHMTVSTLGCRGGSCPTTQDPIPPTAKADADSGEEDGNLFSTGSATAEVGSNGPAKAEATAQARARASASVKVKPELVYNVEWVPAKRRTRLLAGTAGALFLGGLAGYVAATSRTGTTEDHTNNSYRTSCPLDRTTTGLAIAGAGTGFVAMYAFSGTWGVFKGKIHINLGANPNTVTSEHSVQEATFTTATGGN